MKTVEFVVRFYKKGAWALHVMREDIGDKELSKSGSEIFKEIPIQKREHG